MIIPNPFKILYRGYLKESGWLKSLFKGKASSSDGSPYPWLTLPFIHYFLELENIEKRFKKHRLFEFGAGQSTLFFSEYFGEVDSVENDRKWLEYVKSNSPSNCSIIYRAVNRGGKYASAVADSKKKYDLVLVDGRDRVNCVKASVKALTPEGVIVLDNSCRKRYEEALNFMKKQGFKRLDFWGVAPGSSLFDSTTVFYKQNNILGL